MQKNFIKIESGVDTKTSKFSHKDNSKIKGVYSCDISMRIDEPVKAKIGLHVNKVTIEAEPLLSFDTVCEAARYGYDLIPILPDVKAK